MTEIIDSIPDFGPNQHYDTGPQFTYEQIDDSTRSKLIDTSDVAAITQAFKNELIGKSENFNVNTLELLTQLPPVMGIELDKKKFYISKVFSSGDRPHAIGYTQLYNGVIAPRLFYKSFSDGFWRVAPEFHTTMNNGVKGYRYSKGETMEYGYVRETRLVDDLEGMLENMEQEQQIVSAGDLQKICEHFFPYLLGDTNTYKEEAKSGETRIKGFDQYLKYKPGLGFESDDSIPAKIAFSHMELPEDRQPDFNLTPVRTLKRNHSLLGDVMIDVYRSRDGLLHWNMAHTPDGKVWVNGITIPDEGVTSYGTSDEVMTAGVLDNKPLEYASQVEGLLEGIDYVKSRLYPSYVELLVLDNLRPIKEFRAARNIYRAAA